MVKLSDVAQQAGVSATTVSHVINGTRYVSPEVTERVQRAIAQTGYRMNPLARALRTATTQSIGFVASDISNPYSTAVMRGIEHAARGAGHTLLVANADDDPGIEAEAIRALVERRVDGLVVALTSHAPDSTVQMLRELPIPVVLIDIGVDDSFDQVRVEDEAAVLALISHLLDVGHRRIGVVAGVPDQSNSVDRIAAWSVALRARGALPDKSLVAYGGTRADGARMATRRLLSHPDPPTALFTTSHLMTHGALEELAARSITIPAGMAIVAFDEPDYANLLTPPLTCVAQPTFDIGQEAIELLLHRMANPDAAPQNRRLQPAIRHRSSCCGSAYSIELEGRTSDRASTEVATAPGSPANDPQ